MARTRRRRVVVIGDDGTAPLAVAADRLDWKLVGVAEAPSIAAAMRAKERTVDDVLERSKADVAIIGTNLARRADDVRTAASLGLHVVVVPSPKLRLIDVDRADGHAVDSMNERVTVGDPFPTAPATQRWFARLRELPDIATLTGRLRLGRHDELGHLWSLVAGAVLSARLRGQTSLADARIEADSIAGATLLEVGSLSMRLVVDDAAEAGTPLLELQAAGPADALRLEMFPTPHLEHNGSPVDVPTARHPADAFGATDLLANLAADIDTARRPVLDARFHDDVAPLVAALLAQRKR
ncbi:MAG: hypothetical protein ACE37B_03250 [Ilumatobacter sp.]|uniref:hypothetical protein n=1 Tax=Ilumatobacter sp. TaxID=1967498 RepID=UPI00391BFE90